MDLPRGAWQASARHSPISCTRSPLFQSEHCCCPCWQRASRPYGRAARCCSPVAGSFGNATGLAAALFAGSLIVQVAIAGAGAGLGIALPGRRWQRAINAAAAAGILAFGVYDLGRAL
ncbi:MAG: hypothetical protein M3O07_10725 [Pseudomonadota bacterium]|nr:hypothetical protein [Pseudomonadota bacterium]